MRLITLQVIIEEPSKLKKNRNYTNRDSYHVVLLERRKSGARTVIICQHPLLNF